MQNSSYFFPETIQLSGKEGRFYKVGLIANIGTELAMNGKIFDVQIRTRPDLHVSG